MRTASPSIGSMAFSIPARAGIRAAQFKETLQRIAQFRFLTARRSAFGKEPSSRERRSHACWRQCMGTMQRFLGMAGSSSIADGEPLASAWLAYKCVPPLRAPRSSGNYREPACGGSGPRRRLGPVLADMQFLVDVRKEAEGLNLVLRLLHFVAGQKKTHHSGRMLHQLERAAEIRTKVQETRLAENDDSFRE